MEEKKKAVALQKLKVVWLCYFTNNFVQDRIKPSKRIGEIAPWISSMIPLFENNDSIELHIVSQHRWINKYINFEEKGVNYHFYNAGVPLTGRHWPSFFPYDLWTRYSSSKKQVRKIVQEINPDIIHLHGAENEFSASVIQFHNIYPVFITVQGLIHKSNSKSRRTQRRIESERRIYKLYRHFGIRTETMGKDVESLSPNARLHWHSYPMKEIKPFDSGKIFDLVFFARITKDKGIGDLLKAVSILKKSKADISLCVIGGGNAEPFKKLAVDLDIENNVTWAGFLPTQEDVHKMASTAEICVLPTYHDIISGTILESLFLKLPVVAYNVGSIHEVNKHDEIIALVEKLNVDQLAEQIMVLIKDKRLQKERADMGLKRAIEMFQASNEQVRNDLLQAYQKVINDFGKE